MNLDILSDVKKEAEGLNYGSLILMTPNRDEDDPRMRGWLLKRAGKFTGSCFGDLLQKNRKGDGPGEAAKKMIHRVVWERLVMQTQDANGLDRLSFSSRSTNHGNEHEQEALLLYQELSGNEVISDPYGFIEFDEFVGGTPDGLIGKDGGVEIKCPYDGANHIFVLLEGRIYEKKHIAQIQGYMMLTGRKWWDYVTYDPAMPDGLKTAVVRVQRDEEFIKMIKEALEKARVLVEEKLKILLKENNPIT